MDTLLQFVRRRPWEIVLVLALAGTLIELPLAEPSQPVDRPLVALTTPLWLAPVLFRRRVPLLAPVLPVVIVTAIGVASGSAVAELTVPSLFAVVAMPWLAATTLGWGRGLPPLAGILVCSTVLVLTENGDASGVVFVWFVGAGAFLAGATLGVRRRDESALAERADALERIRQEEADAAAAEERARIARELHEVIAHAVSAMTVQAGAARLLLDQDPRRALAPAAAVEDTGRQALAELRRLLGILRSEDGAERSPQPGIEALPELLEQARASGLDVDLLVEGASGGSASGVDLAAYRVVQEALAEAARTAGPTRARVVVRYTPEAVELDITQDAGPVAAGPPQLVVARERIALYDGELSTEEIPGGGRRLRVRLPRAAA